MEYMTDLTSAYVPLSLVPQPLKHHKRGQLGLTSSNSPTTRKSQSGAAIISCEPSVENPELSATKRTLQERYQLDQDEHHLSASSDDDAQASQAAQQPPHLLQRKLALQRLGKHKLRAAAVRSTAEAVQEWFKWGGPSTCPAADALSAKALLVLNAEAEKGLLHLISAGLMPEALDLTPGLCGGLQSPLTFKPTQLHTPEARQSVAPGTHATSAAWRAPAATSAKQQAYRIPAIPVSKQQSVINIRHRPFSVPEPQTPAMHMCTAVVNQQISPVEAMAVSATLRQPIGYEALLDNLCEHQLLIFKGKLVQDTPQVLPFIRAALPLWSTVSMLLSQLEALCRVFKVEKAIIDGKEVMQLAQNLVSCGRSSNSIDKTEQITKPAAELSDLLCCFANLEELEHLFSSVDEEMAVSALQIEAEAAEPCNAQCNGDPTISTVISTAQQPIADLNSAEQQQTADTLRGTDSVAAATTGAAVVSSAAPRSQCKAPNGAEAVMLETMYQARQERDEAFQLLQHSLRRHWRQIKQQRHVILHLPSLPVKHPHLASQQQQQLWRILDVTADSISQASEWHANDIGNSHVTQSKKVLHDVATDALCVDDSYDSFTTKSHHDCKKCVVLVTSQPVSKQLQNYWYQLLRGVGVPEPSSFIRFVSTSLPEHQGSETPEATLPLAARLMASSKAMDKCKQIISAVSCISTKCQQPTSTTAAEASHRQHSDSSNAATDAGHQLVHNNTSASDVGSDVKAVPGGYIVPGVPSDHDVDVAVKLGLPILGPTPQLAHVLGSKTGARSLFAAAGIRTPPGGILPRLLRSNKTTTTTTTTSSCVTDANVAAWQHLLSCMCIQMLQYPQQEQWMLKLNDGLHGAKGLAVLGLAAMQATQAALATAVQLLEATEQQQLQQHTSPNEPLRAYNLSAVPADKLQAALHHLLPVLASELPMGLQLAQPTYWKQQAVETGTAVIDEDHDEQLMEAAVEAYLSELLQLGGVMEAFLANLVCCPLVQLLLEPSGDISVIATQDKIMHEGYSSPGSLFPSGCPAHAALVQAAIAAGEAAMAAGMLGYLQVAFLCTSKFHLQHDAQHDPNSSHMRDGSARMWRQGIGTCTECQGQQIAGCLDSDAPANVMSDVLLWGCDLLPCPSPDLSMYKLFHAVKQGRFHPVEGCYVVPQRSTHQQHHRQQHDSADDEQGVNTSQQEKYSQHCSYACLHNPAAVLAPEQLSIITQKGLLAAGSNKAGHGSQKAAYGHQMEAAAVLHCFATSGEVILSMDASHSSYHHSAVGCLSRGKEGMCTGGCRGPTAGSAAEEHLPVAAVAADSGAWVSGIVCCSTGYDAVGALSCLLGFLGNLAPVQDK